LHQMFWMKSIGTFVVVLISILFNFCFWVAFVLVLSANLSVNPIKILPQIGQRRPSPRWFYLRNSSSLAARLVKPLENHTSREDHDMQNAYTRERQIPSSNDEQTSSVSRDLT
jgi:hypothetical protein